MTEQLAKPIPERWLDLHAEAVTDLTKWPTERAPENLFYQVKELVEELGASESRVRELEQALRDIKKHIEIIAPQLAPLNTSWKIACTALEALQVTDKATKK